MEEIWKDIKGYEGIYQVSNLGRIKSLPRKRVVGWAKYTTKERIIKQCNHRQGYKLVLLHKDCKKKLYKVHRLVADAFIPNPLKLRCINHKDENKANNHVDNLEWCNHSYNNNYGTRNEKVKKSNGKRVQQYTLNGTLVKEWVCVREAQRETNIRNIYDVCNGKRKSAGGYIWKYKN